MHMCAQASAAQKASLKKSLIPPQSSGGRTEVCASGTARGPPAAGGMSWAHLGQIWGGWAAYVVHWRGEIGWDPPRPQQVGTDVFFFSTFLHVCTLVQIRELELVGALFHQFPFCRRRETGLSHLRNVGCALQKCVPTTRAQQVLTFI